MSDLGAASAPRRHIYDEYEKTKSPIAEEALRRIGQLYEVEAAITGMTAEQRVAARREHAAPILADLKEWFEAQRRRLSSKSTLYKAIGYAVTRWDSLTLYVADGRIGIDNNPAERSLRGIALTRKNFLFLGSEAGGDRAAILYTVLESALCRARHKAVYAERRTMPSGAVIHSIINDLRALGSA